MRPDTCAELITTLKSTLPVLENFPLTNAARSRNIPKLQWLYFFNFSTSMAPVKMLTSRHTPARRQSLTFLWEFLWEPTVAARWMACAPILAKNSLPQWIPCVMERLSTWTALTGLQLRRQLLLSASSDAACKDVTFSCTAAKSHKTACPGLDHVRFG